MFANICRGTLRVPPKVSIFVTTQFFASSNAVFNRAFSSKQSFSDVNGDDLKQCFTVSYLINSCGLSSNDALSISKKVTIKSIQNPDSVLELLRKYGFTDAYISKIVIRLPNLLLSCPEKTLLPKLEFFLSIGIPRDVLARNLSSFPVILHRSLENYLIPTYNFIKTLVKSDRKVVNVFKNAPRAFAPGWQKITSSNITILRERGIPESSIVSLMTSNPSFLIIVTKKLASYIDRAAEMGFDRSKAMFIHALQLFISMSESTLKHKMEVYRRWGWSESDISLAMSKNPLCMTISEKKIMDNMNFLVNDLGLQPDAVARRPVLLSLNLDRRMYPRFFVARVSKERGLLKKRDKGSTFLELSEEKFLKKYIVKYQEDVPQLLDIYRGKLSVSEMGFSSVKK